VFFNDFSLHFYILLATGGTSRAWRSHEEPLSSMEPWSENHCTMRLNFIASAGNKNLNNKMWLVFKSFKRPEQLFLMHWFFDKAFDQVPHQLLLQKLQYYNVNPTVINWIESLFFCPSIQSPPLPFLFPAPQDKGSAVSFIRESKALKWAFLILQSKN